MNIEQLAILFKISGFFFTQLTSRLQWKIPKQLARLVWKIFSGKSQSLLRSGVAPLIAAQATGIDYNVTDDSDRTPGHVTQQIIDDVTAK